MWLTSELTPSFFTFIFLWQNIREVLNKTPEGKSLVVSLDEHKHVSISERRLMVRILVSHLIERYREK